MIDKKSIIKGYIDKRVHRFFKRFLSFGEGARPGGPPFVYGPGTNCLHTILDRKFVKNLKIARQ